MLANLQNMVIKPVHPDIGFRFRFGADLSTDELESLKQRIKSRPHLYVGQEAMSMSTVPILDPSVLRG